MRVPALLLLLLLLLYRWQVAHSDALARHRARWNRKHNGVCSSADLARRRMKRRIANVSMCMCQQMRNAMRML